MRGYLPFIGALLMVVAVADPAQPATPNNLIREEQTVIVGGITETWRLQWEAPPQPYCDAHDVGAITCPCTGFAFGEKGKLDLVRLRNGREIERMPLTPFFQGLNDSGDAALQRWPRLKEDIGRVDNDDGLPEEVRHRAPIKIMQMADYNHDGQATEFLLQVDTMPCGKEVAMVIGVSPENPHLHAFSSVANPNQPLYLYRHEWEALRDAKQDKITVIDWLCADHGSDVQTELELSLVHSAIGVTSKQYECMSDSDRGQLPPNKRGRLLKEEPR